MSRKRSSRSYKDYSPERKYPKSSFSNRERIDTRKHSDYSSSRYSESSRNYSGLERERNREYSRRGESNDQGKEREIDREDRKRDKDWGRDRDREKFRERTKEKGREGRDIERERYRERGRRKDIERDIERERRNKNEKTNRDEKEIVKNEKTKEINRKHEESSNHNINSLRIQQQTIQTQEKASLETLQEINGKINQTEQKKTDDNYLEELSLQMNKKEEINDPQVLIEERRRKRQELLKSLDSTQNDEKINKNSNSNGDNTEKENEGSSACKSQDNLIVSTEIFPKVEEKQQQQHSITKEEEKEPNKISEAPSVQNIEEDEEEIDLFGDDPIPIDTEPEVSIFLQKSINFPFH